MLSTSSSPHHSRAYKEPPCTLTFLRQCTWFYLCCKIKLYAVFCKTSYGKAISDDSEIIWENSSKNDWQYIRLIIAAIVSDFPI